MIESQTVTAYDSAEMPRWIRYQVREKVTPRPEGASAWRFTPHYATDPHSGAVNYDAKKQESAVEYAKRLGVPAYVVQVTESVVAQF